MKEENLRSIPHYHCFRCKTGCVHVVCGSAMLTFIPEHFLIFADAINEMSRQLREADEFSIASEHLYPDSPLM